MKSRDTVVLSADVFGYTRLVNDFESETLERLLLYHRIFRKYTNRAGGRIFNYAGDAVLAEFPKVDPALIAAVKIQQQIRRHNLNCPLGQRMLFRMGIHAGRVFERGADLLGDTVNIAARLQTVAEPGGICVSQNIYLGMSQGLGISVDDVGMQSLKNIPDLIQAYALAFDQGSFRGSLRIPNGFILVSRHPRAFATCLGMVVLMRIVVHSSAGSEQSKEAVAILPTRAAVASKTISQMANADRQEISLISTDPAPQTDPVERPTAPKINIGKVEGDKKPDTEADPIKAGLFVGSLLFGGIAALSAIDEMKHGTSNDNKTQALLKPSGGKMPTPNKDLDQSIDLIPLSPTAQISSISRCKLTIAQQIVFDSGCEYAVSPNYTTFEAPSLNGKLSYNAKINLNPDRTGDGFLRGGTSNQERSLGAMTRHGACWVNTDGSVQLCAWK